MVEQIKLNPNESALKSLLSQPDVLKKKDGLSSLRRKNFNLMKKLDTFNLDKESWKYTPFFKLTKGISFRFFPAQKKKSIYQKERLKKIKDFLTKTFSQFESSFHLVFINGDLRLELSKLLISKEVNILSFSTLFSSDLLDLKKKFPLKKKEKEDLEKIKHHVVQKIESKVQHSHNRKEGFSFLNDALFSDGSVIHVKKRTKMSSPIHLIFISDQSLVHGRDFVDSSGDRSFTQQIKNFIFCDPFSEALITESYFSFSKSMTFTNTKTDFLLSNGSKLNHVRIQNEDVRSFHVGESEMRLEKKAHLRSFYFSFGAKLSHVKARFDLAGESSSVESFGVYLLNSNQHMNQNIDLHHRAPFSSGTQLSKSVLLDASQAIFNGKVKIENEGHKVYSNQMSRNLILSSKGDVKTNPQLEVHTNDVTATHGATVSRLNEEQILYLKTRGLTHSKAIFLLLEGFVRDIFLKLDQSSKKNLETFLNKTLSEFIQ